MTDLIFSEAARAALAGAPARLSMAFDCETELIAPGRVVPRLVCVSVQLINSDNSEPHGPPLLFDAGEGFPAFLRAVLPRLGWLVGHNVAFDCAVICRAWPSLASLVWALYDEGRVYDTGLSERLKALALGWSVHPATGRAGVVSRSLSLSDLVTAHLGLDIGAAKFDPSSPRYHYARLVGVPLEEWSEEARRYALDDARLTARVACSQWRDLEGVARRADLPLDKVASPAGDLYSYASLAAQAGADFALIHLRAWGLRSVPARVAAWREALEARKADLLKRPQAAGLVRANGKRDLKALRAAVELAYGAADCPRTDKGAVSTSGDVLKGAGEPVLDDLAELGEVDKLLSTFGPTLDAAAAGPLCPRYNVLVRSGRTSCVKPNVQQLPRKGAVREAFAARSGCVYIGADYSTAELVALADVCERWGLRSRMAEQIREGRDLHLALAADVLGLAYDEAARLKREGDARVNEERQRAKIPNFGLPGGLGAQGLVDYAASGGATLSLDEAREMRAAWFRSWPEMRAYFERVEAAVEAGRVVQVGSNRVRGGVGYTDAANSYFQGLVADGAKRAVYEVVKACYMQPSSPLYGARPVLFVHDEIICECEEARAPAAADELARLMCEAMNKHLTHLEMSADAWVSRTWRKGLEGVRDEHGALVILD
jgi:hypothetical protein